MNKMICNYCFEDDKIQKYITTNGIEADNGYICTCGRQNDEDEETKLYLLAKNILADKLAEVIEHLYIHEDIHGMGGSARSFVEGDEDPFDLAWLEDVQDICMDCFEDDCFMLAEFIVNNKSYDEFNHFESSFYREWKDRCFFENEEEDQYSLSKWQKFCENVKHKARYFDHDAFSVTETLADFNDFFEQITSFDLNENIFRARKIYNDKDRKDIDSDPNKELGSVPVEFAKNNRFSPMGISYGYFAYEKDTALKEIRATVSDKVAIGEFNLNSELKVIDFRTMTMSERFLNYFDDDFNEKFYCISHFIHEFIADISKSVSDDKQLLEYIPTQIMSEYIWSKGYDGFMFDSSVNNGGTNIVLFEKQYSFSKYEIYFVKSIDMNIEQLV